MIQENNTYIRILEELENSGIETTYDSNGNYSFNNKEDYLEAVDIVNSLVGDFNYIAKENNKIISVNEDKLSKEYLECYYNKLMTEKDNISEEFYINRLQALKEYLSDSDLNIEEDLISDSLIEQDLVEEDDNSLLEEKIEYKGFLITKFDYDMEIANESNHVESWIILSNYKLDDDLYLPLYCEDPDGEVLDFDTLDEAKLWIDNYGGNCKLEIKHRNEIHAIPNIEEEIEVLDETYDDDELKKMKNKVYNQQKIIKVYRRMKYGEKKLFAHTRCTQCGKEKRVFLSNLIKDPDKYGSCICSDTNIESRMDTITGLYKGTKKLSSNTSGYTGVSFVKKYRGEPYNKWRAYIEIDGHRNYLGDFNSKSKAIRARRAAAEKGLKWYGEHKNEFMSKSRRRHKKNRKKKSK